MESDTSITIALAVREHQRSRTNLAVVEGQARQSCICAMTSVCVRVLLNRRAYAWSTEIKKKPCCRGGPGKAEREMRKKEGGQIRLLVYRFLHLLPDPPMNSPAPG